MRNTLLLLAFLFTGFGTLNAQERLTADKDKTTLQWLGEKVLGQHTGTINLQDGWLSLKDNKIISGEFTIDMTTICKSAPALQLLIS